MRAGRAFPLAGAHQHLAVLAAFAAMKFVNWHENSVANVVPCTKGKLFIYERTPVGFGLVPEVGESEPTHVGQLR